MAAAVKTLIADEDGKRIDIKDVPLNMTERHKHRYTCPVCCGELVACKGKKRAWHFAHKSNAQCDTWSDGMGDWHYSWERRFSEASHDVSLEVPFDGVDSDGRHHRCDVLVGDMDSGTVVELQHSPMSEETFDARNEFYGSRCKNVCWLFDCTDGVHKYATVMPDEYADAFVDFDDEWHERVLGRGKEAEKKVTMTDGLVALYLSYVPRCLQDVIPETLYVHGRHVPIYVQVGDNAIAHILKPVRPYSSDTPTRTPSDGAFLCQMMTVSKFMRSVLQGQHGDVEIIVHDGEDTRTYQAIAGLQTFERVIGSCEPKYMGQRKKVLCDSMGHPISGKSIVTKHANLYWETRRRCIYQALVSFDGKERHYKHMQVAEGEKIGTVFDRIMNAYPDRNYTGVTSSCMAIEEWLIDKTGKSECTDQLKPITNCSDLRVYNDITFVQYLYSWLLCVDTETGEVIKKYMIHASQENIHDDVTAISKGLSWEYSADLQSVYKTASGTVVIPVRRFHFA